MLSIEAIRYNQIRGIMRKHLGFVGKSTEHLGYTHVEVNSSLRLSFNVPLKENTSRKSLEKMVESNYDLLMATSSEISFELDP